MRCLLLCQLGVLLVATGAQCHQIDFLDTGGFGSRFLNKTENTQGILNLMNGHFVNSLDYLFAGKYYGSQDLERPGIAKLLMEESNRHWDEGMSVLKKYLHIGGITVEDSFINSMDITRKNDMFEQGDPSEVKYKTSLKMVMEKSQELGNSITDLYHQANHKESGHGDADVAHFLEEKAEKESDVARKMVGHYVALQKMALKGIACDFFDQNL